MKIFNKIKRGLIPSDYYVMITIFLVLFTHSITIFLVEVNTTPDMAIENREKVIETLEMNPVAAKILVLKKFKFLYSYLIVPSSLIMLYYLTRKYYMKNEIKKEFVEALSFGIMIMFGMNFLNDVTYLLTYLYLGG